MIIHYKSSENMDELKDDSVQLVVTSPPYPMISKWDKMFKIIDFDKQHEALKKIWAEVYRILIPGGMFCLNIGDATRTINKNFCCYPNYAKAVMDCVDVGFNSLIPIFWRKISNRPNAFLGSGFLPPNAYVSQDCEYIAIFRKGTLRKFKPKDQNRLDSSFIKKERDTWFNQVWEISGAKNAKKTSVFPEEIPRRLIRMFSVKGDTVVDPFCGVGTTLKIAVKLDRKAVGYEINKKVNNL
jgi:site-specific DNA-methyltransferase (cytosine-N4-specific)